MVGGRRVGGERLVGDVPAAVGVGHRLHQQVARVQPGHVVVRVALVEEHHMMPLVPGKQSEGETDQRSKRKSSFQFPIIFRQSDASLTPGKWIRSVRLSAAFTASADTRLESRQTSVLIVIDAR